MEELYEELPGGEEEDLYEDLPDSAYIGQDSAFSSGYPISPSHNQVTPPPLPTSSIPQFRPGAPPPPISAPPPSLAPTPPVPPLPTRSPTTQLSSKPPTGQAKKGKDLKKKPPPLKSTPSSGSAGIDMNEILKKAKSRSTNYENLEKKFKDASEDKHIAPWANQLRKTPRDDEAAKRGLLDSQESEVPEFIRKARTLSIATDADVDGDGRPSPSPPLHPPAVSKKPPPVASTKPRVPSPGSMMPKVVEGESSSTAPKPAWQKQRERQVALSQSSGGDGVGGESKPAKYVPAKPSPAIPNKPAVAGRPPLPGKVSPTLLPKAPIGDGSNGHKSNAPPLQVTPKPKPKPTPRNLPSTIPVLSPRHENGTVNGISEPDLTISPRTLSIKDKARFLEKSMGVVDDAPPPPSTAPPPPSSAPPPPSAAPPTSKPPPPKPVPRSPSNHNIQPPLPRKPASSPPTPGSKPAGSSPSSRRPYRVAPPIPNGKLPPPPPETPPPSSTTPPLPTKAPPAPVPGLAAATQAQPTPPMGSVMKFRRLPLRPVDLFNPPPPPSRDTKPSWPQINGK